MHRSVLHLSSLLTLQLFQAYREASITPLSPAVIPHSLMASTKDTLELLVVWLAPPDALVPSHYNVKIYPVPIAVSVTLASFTILVLIIMYNRKPQNTNTLHTEPDAVVSKDSTNDFELKEIPRLSVLSSSSVTRSQEAERRSIALQKQPPSIPPLRDAMPVHMMYHEHLFDSRYGSYRHSCRTTDTSPSIDSYYHTLDDQADVTKSSNNNVSICEPTSCSSARPVITTAASSSYSVSTYEATVDGQNDNSRSLDALGT